MSQTKLETADALLRSVLERTNLPVSRPPYGGSAAQYLTYQFIVQTQKEHCDDDNDAHEVMWSVDLYSRGPWLALLDLIESLTKAAGFYGFRAGPELYERETRLYHIPIDIYYLITED